MSLLKLIENAVEGAAQLPAAATKTAAGAVIGALDEGEAAKQGAKQIREALDKIGKSE